MLGFYHNLVPSLNYLGQSGGPLPIPTTAFLIFILVVQAIMIGAGALLYRRRKRLESELIASENRYKQIVESQHEMVCRFLPDGVLTFVNGAYCRFFGLSREELLGKSIYDLIPPEDQGHFSDTLRRVRDKQTVQTEHRAISREGDSAWMFWENHPIPDERGEVFEIQAVGRDITVRRNALESLRQSEERFSGIFRGSPEAIGIIRQSDGAYVEVNPSWEAFFEIERSSAIGSNPVDLGILVQSEASWNLDRFLASGKSLRSFELSFKTREGKLRWTSLSCELAHLDDQPCYIVMHKDITERREAENVRQNLAHATKLAMLGELTASIAHEINQPLGAILSNADTAEILLAGESPSLPELRQIIADIRRDDLRASQIIRKIRGMIGKREMTPEPLDANELIRNIETLIAHDIKRHGVKLMRELAPDLPAVNGDRIHLEQLLLNLVLNAIDALQRKHITERWIVIRTLLNGDDQLEISVEDNGPGVPSAMLAKIFDSFFTTKSTGMGLGLALSMSIAEAHGGRLAARNNPHGGTTLRLLLPALIPEYASHRDRDTVCLPC